MQNELELFVEELSEQKIAPTGCFSTGSTLACATGCASSFSTVGSFSC